MAIKISTPSPTVNAPRWHSRVDAIGAGLSFACAVHCIVLPIAIGILPFLGLTILADHDAERLFVFASVVLAFISLCLGYRLHRDHRAFMVLLVAVSLLAGGLILAHDIEHTLLVVVGAFGITASHLLNRRFCKRCSQCSCHSNSCDSNS